MIFSIDVFDVSTEWLTENPNCILIFKDFNRIVSVFIFPFVFQDKKNKAQRFPLMGYEVYFVGTVSGKDHVLRISHASMKHPLLLATNSKVVTDKWVAVSLNLSPLTQ